MAGSFAYSPQCPQLGIRLYNYYSTNDTNQYNEKYVEGHVSVDFVISGPAPNDTFWANISFSDWIKSGCV